MPEGLQTGEDYDYKMYVGVNYPTGDKSYEWSLTSIDNLMMVLKNFLTDESSATSFIFTIVPTGKKDADHDLVGSGEQSR
jgi:phage-related protein